MQTETTIKNTMDMAAIILHYAGSRQLFLPDEASIGTIGQMPTSIRFRYTNHPHNTLAILGEKDLNFRELTVRQLEDLLQQPEFDTIHIFDGVTPLSKLPRKRTDYFSFSKNPALSQLYMPGQWEQTLREIYDSVVRTFDLKEI